MVHYRQVCPYHANSVEREQDEQGTVTTYRNRMFFKLFYVSYCISSDMKPLGEVCCV